MRETGSQDLAGGLSLSAIAQKLQRAPSTINRELSRHFDTASYSATVADRRARHCKLAVVPQLARCVASKNRHNWSPEQIARRIRRTYHEAARVEITHETISKSLLVPARGVLR